MSEISIDTHQINQKLKRCNRTGPGNNYPSIQLPGEALLDKLSAFTSEVKSTRQEIKRVR